MRRCMRAAAAGLLAGTMVLGVASTAHASGTGRTGQTLKTSLTAGCGARVGGTGSCHGTSANPSITVLMTGPSVLPVGTPGTYTLSLSGSTGSGGGFDIAAGHGTLAALLANTKLQDGELTHTSGITVPYAITFRYSSAAAGRDTLFANGKGHLLTGEWNWAPNFFVRVGPPPAPLLSSPANATTGVSTQAKLTWTSAGGTAAGATWTVEVSTSSSFGTTVVHQDVPSGSSFTVPQGKLLNNTQYFWRVSTTDSGGTSPWSAPVWSFTTALTAVQELAGAAPAAYALLQNYPNPFNPETVIGFRVRDFGPVRLTVYDMLGREVATLVNESKSPGEYAVKFSGARLASGTYVYRLEAGAFQETRRMLLVK